MGLAGQLTCTLHLEPLDTASAQSLMHILERKAGRVLANGFPTGVEVCDAMVHGGPYPASTNFWRYECWHLGHAQVPAPGLLSEHA